MGNKDVYDPPVCALLAVADPTDWSPTQPESVDLPGEVERARAVLGDIPTTVLPAPCSGARATLASIAAALRDTPQICYLVGHGLIVGETPCLWMEQPDGSGAPVTTMTLAAQLIHAGYRPLLVVLAAYVEAGSPDDTEALVAAGLGLAQAGLPAVLAVPGSSPAATMDRFLAIFFRALRREGRLDRALAVARDAVPTSGDQPVLFLSGADGQISQEPPLSVEHFPLANEARPDAPYAARNGSPSPSVPADMV